MQLNRLVCEKIKKTPRTPLSYKGPKIKPTYLPEEGFTSFIALFYSFQAWDSFMLSFPLCRFAYATLEVLMVSKQNALFYGFLRSAFC